MRPFRGISPPLTWKVEEKRKAEGGSLADTRRVTRREPCTGDGSPSVRNRFVMTKRRQLGCEEGGAGEREGEEPGSSEAIIMSEKIVPGGKRRITRAGAREPPSGASFSHKGEPGPSQKKRRKRTMSEKEFAEEKKPKLRCPGRARSSTKTRLTEPQETQRKASCRQKSIRGLSLGGGGETLSHPHRNTVVSSHISGETSAQVPSTSKRKTMDRGSSRETEKKSQCE